MHISPNEKVYVGITSKFPASLRWGNRGEYYSENIYFSRAISKYGWNNFQHIILADNLEESDAKLLEVYYIKLFRSNEGKFGYNLTSGGEHNYPNDVVRKKLSVHMKSIMPKLKSEEAMAKFKNTRRMKYESGYSPIWMNDGNKEVLVDISLSDDYINQGYKRGRITSRIIYVNDEISEKRIDISEKSAYLSNGWKLGRCRNTKQSFKKSNQQFRYMYLGLELTSTYEVAEFLKKHGYPTISDSSVQNITDGKCVKRYADLTGMISKERIK